MPAKPYIIIFMLLCAAEPEYNSSSRCATQPSATAFSAIKE